MGSGITLRLHIDGARETLAAFQRLGKEASAELRDANQHISEELAGKIRSAALASSKQSALVAVGIKAKRDRVPSVQAGGSTRVGRNRKPLNKILFGANFGATYLKQFRKHNGGAGSADYWFFSTVDANEAGIVRQWEDTADRLLRDWGE